MQQSAPATLAPQSHTAPRAADRSLPASVLDTVILVYAAILLSVVMFGGFDLGFVSATHAAKPLLVLVLLVPTRLAVGGQTWLTARLAAPISVASRVWTSMPLPAAVQDAIFALVFTRAATFVIAFVANILLIPKLERPFSVPLPWPKLAETFAVWDSGWYFDIASRGYYFNPDGQSSVAFFPLYPLLVRLAASPFGDSPAAIWVAAIGVSGASFFGSLIALHQLSERLTGSREAARRTILYIAVFPFSIYFTRVYTEALFLLLTVLSVRAAHESRWLWAGIIGALATLTRPNGILIALPLLIMACGGRPSWRTFGRRIVALALIPTALTGYSAYVYSLSGNPLAWLTVQRHWRYSLGHMPHRHLLGSLSAIEEQGVYSWLLHSETAPLDFFYVLIALLFLALIPGVIRKFGLAAGVYVLVSLLIPLSGNVLVGVGRYASVLFPVFMFAGTIGSSRVCEAILLVSAMFRTLFLMLLVNWYPLH
jgi:Mannosyltransferase (PIG-V)